MRKQSAFRRTRLRVAYKYPATAAKAFRRFSFRSPSHASSHRYLTLLHLTIIQPPLVLRAATVLGRQLLFFFFFTNGAQFSPALSPSVRSCVRFPLCSCAKRQQTYPLSFEILYYAKPIEWNRPGVESLTSFYRLLMKSPK